MSGVIEQALLQLEGTVSALDGAAQRRIAVDRFRSDLDEAFAAMQDDRSRLGLELDEALARARKLEFAHDEAVKRLETMGQSLTHLIAQA